MPRTKYRLPSVAEHFLALRGHRQLEPVVRNLHDWMARKRIEFTDLTPAHLQAFLRKPIGVERSETSRNTLYRNLEPYLLWLHDQGQVRFRADRQVRRAFPLPESARAFVEAMRPTRKPSTCDCIITALRDLHAWLAAQDIALVELDRPAMERWLKAMADRGLAPSTRSERIFRVRTYLAWLVERGALSLDPDDLLRPTDLPKLPSYLPRPFPRDVDREMQRRLLASDTLYGKALFLMRRTGLRIGELARLEPRCLQADRGEQAFLKVPLGKLDNERLVPLDQETQEVLESLTRLCPRGAPFLLEPELRRETLLQRLSATLKQTAAGIDIPGPVVSHRLRHTYATELLNAGMSLVSIMKLLGHRSVRMTMRYAAITQNTVVKDYHAAIAEISAQYDVPLPPSLPSEPDPERMLTDTISWLRNNARDDRRAQLLIKRLYKVRDDIAPLVEQHRSR